MLVALRCQNRFENREPVVWRLVAKVYCFGMSVNELS